MNKRYAGCTKPLMKFTDEKHNDFYITSECGQCYDIVYNGQPTWAADLVEKNGCPADNILLDLTVEDEKETAAVLDAFFSGEDKWRKILPKYTRGHHLNITE